MKKSLFSGATEREKAMEVQFHKYYPCFTRLCLPYKPPLRRSNSTRFFFFFSFPTHICFLPHLPLPPPSSLFVTYTIDVMDLKEVVKCASHALYLIILYCHGRGGFSSMEILNEEAHPMVEVLFFYYFFQIISHFNSFHFSFFFFFFFFFSRTQNKVKFPPPAPSLTFVIIS